MSDSTPKPLTEGQKAILDSIPVLPSPAFSIQDRISLAQKIDTLGRYKAALREIIERFDELNGVECKRGCGQCIRCIAQKALQQDP